jgi:uncharacterized protein with PhoU and TrkA domain
MELNTFNITVKSIRRAGIRGDDPSLETLLQVGDVLILEGKSAHFQQAEKQLRYGLKSLRKNTLEISTAKPFTTDN